jgi:hypothetical protein
MTGEMEELQFWYLAPCDGGCEHGFGGPLTPGPMIRVFLDWVRQAPAQP